MPSEKVLIVDDEKLVRWSLRQKCEEWGYNVLEADNGTAALRVAHNEFLTSCCWTFACPTPAVSKSWSS